MTFDDIRQDGGMPETITISGTRAPRHRPPGEYGRLFVAYLAPFAMDAAHFYIGGASGIDSLSLLWLASETRSRITVVVPGTITDQPADACRATAIAQGAGRLAELVELRRPDHPSTGAFHYRNRWMVDRSDFVIAFPRGENQTSGTWYTANYAANQGKPRLIVPA